MPRSLNIDWTSTLIAYLRSGHPDLTNRQMALLMVVYETPGPHTVRSLALKLDVSKSVITRALNKLSNMKFIVRRGDERDRRNVFIEPTPSGADFLCEVASLIVTG